MSLIKISLITASFNNADTIKSTIDSVLNQTYKNTEYIIIDGVSTDGTKEIIDRYGKQISVFLSEPDKGMYFALNKGIQIASGDVIGFIHADDFYATNDIIEKVAGRFSCNDTDSVYGDLQYVYKNNLNKVLRYWKSGNFSLKKMNAGWMPPHPTLFIKKDIYNKYGLFNTSFSIAADYEIMTRFLCLHKMSTVYIPEVFIKMRWGGKSNSSIKNIIIKSWEDYKAIRRNKVGNIFTLAGKNLSKVNQFLKK